MSNGDIYRETIFDHYRNTRNKGRLSNHDVSVQDSNPLCDDEIVIHLKVEASMIKDIKFEGRGCAISQASASQLTEMVINKPLIFVMNLSKGDIVENMGLTKRDNAEGWTNNQKGVFVFISSILAFYVYFF